MMPNYHDKYFEHGHWLLKIRQTLLMLFSWVLFFLPILITGATYLAYRTHGRRGWAFWHYTEGIQELDFLLIFLTFADGVIAVFCLSLGFIQMIRTRGLTNNWPMFDFNQNARKARRAERVMTKRFGNKQFRQQQRYYSVRAEQNLQNNQLNKIVNGQEQDEDYDG